MIPDEKSHGAEVRDENRAKQNKNVTFPTISG